MNEAAGNIPKWFKLSEAAAPQVMKRIADAVSKNEMALQVKSAPMLSHWFILDSLVLANQANRAGMHANALALTRQCVEAMSIVELGVCGHPDAEATLSKWESDKLTPGGLRGWLQANVWPHYGCGLWDEPWTEFMREFAAAVQPYSHYTPALAQWQLRLHSVENTSAVIEMRPRAYDAQKATRITLFHAILTFALARMWTAAHRTDQQFAALINRLRMAIAESRYLDGRGTKWGQQFWAMVWLRSGSVLLE